MPIIWNEPQDHPNDCYFCTTNIKRLNPNKKTEWYYPELESVRQLIPHSDFFPVPVHTSSSGNSLADSGEFCESDIITVNTNVSEYQACCLTSNQFSQNELSDLIRDLNLSKQASELLASRLKEKNCLTSDTRITAYRIREKSFLPYFSQDEKLLYCNNIHGLFMQLGISEYKSDNWRLFIDSSTRSLKCVLLHNTNQYASISIAHPATLEEEYEDIKIILQKIRYNEHQWSIYVDLRMVNYLLGQ